MDDISVMKYMNKVHAYAFDKQRTVFSLQKCNLESCNIKINRKKRKMIHTHKKLYAQGA